MIQRPQRDLFFLPPLESAFNQHYVACTYDVLLEVLLHTYMLHTETDSRQPFLFASCTNIWRAALLGVGGHFDSIVGANIRRLFRRTFAPTFVPGGHPNNTGAGVEHQNTLQNYVKT
jgi:hypothetical protein